MSEKAEEVKKPPGTSLLGSPENTQELAGEIRSGGVLVDPRAWSHLKVDRGLPGLKEEGNHLLSGGL
jgi:hypothetical protein